MKRRDISDLEVCRAVAQYHKDMSNNPYPYIYLSNKFNCDEKLAYSACERAYGNGLINFGVSLRTGWLTEKGEKLLNHLSTVLSK